MEINTIGDIKIITIEERLDASNSEEVDTVFKTFIEEGIRKIIFDFSQTDYIASSGLRILLSAAKNMQKINGQLVVCSLKAYVKEVFDIAGFTQLFTIYGSTEEAVKNLSNN